MGLNRADLSGIDKMTPGQFNDFLDRTMMEGKTLGRLEKGEAGNALRKAEDRQIVRRGNGAAESVADNRLRVQKEKGLDNGGIMGGDTTPRKEDDNEP